MDVEDFGRAFQAFLERVVEAAPSRPSPLLERLTEHLGRDPLELPLTGARLLPFEHPDLQVALDGYSRTEGREVDLVGLPGEQWGSTAELLMHARAPIVAPVFTELPVDVDARLACLRAGVLLVSGDRLAPHAIIVRVEEHGPVDNGLVVEVLAAEPDTAAAVLAELRERMSRDSVFRGKVITLSGGGPFGGAPGATFLPRPRVVREDIILPEGRLDVIERRTLRFDAVADRLAAQGMSRKRGILLYGPPGTGKTLTVQYLIGALPERTVVVLTGQALGAIGPATRLARRLAPAVLVLEDVDLIAGDRGFDDDGNPLLFELLNELDGLDREDEDVIVLLTTNRPDLLEAALAARPGRVDLAVELPLPDADGRRRLLERCTRDVDVDVDDWEPAIERTEGTPASFIAELVRSAAVLAAQEQVAAIDDAHVEAALVELLDSGPLTAALLGVRWSDEHDLLPPGPAVRHGYRQLAVLDDASDAYGELMG